MKLALFSILLPLVTSTPLLNIGIHISDNKGISDSRDTSYHLQHVLDEPSIKKDEAGKVSIDDSAIRVRLYGNFPWWIRGVLDKSFPPGEALFNPVVLKFEDQKDFEGKFNGTIGNGEIVLNWENGASLSGESDIGDYKISGETRIVDNE